MKGNDGWFMVIPYILISELWFLSRKLALGTFAPVFCFFPNYRQGDFAVHFLGFRAMVQLVRLIRSGWKPVEKVLKASRCFCLLKYQQNKLQLHQLPPPATVSMKCNQVHAFFLRPNWKSTQKLSGIHQLSLIEPLPCPTCEMKTPSILTAKQRVLGG